MMKILLATLALSLSTFTSTHANTFDPLIGTWKVIDDRTGSYISDIVIRKNSTTQIYSAVTVKYYPVMGVATSELCTKCTGSYKDQPIVGMEIFTGLKATNSKQFKQGVWIHPRDGQTYYLTTTLSSTGNQMKVHAKQINGSTTNNMTWQKL